MRTNLLAAAIGAVALACFTGCSSDNVDSSAGAPLVGGGVSRTPAAQQAEAERQLDEAATSVEASSTNTVREPAGSERK